MKKLTIAKKLEVEWGDSEMIFPFKDKKTLFKFNELVRKILFEKNSKHHDLSTNPLQLMIRNPVWDGLDNKDQESILDGYKSLI